MHVAGFVEGVVECERTLEVDGSLPGDTALEVFKQQGTLVGTCADVDDFVSALYGVFHAQIGYTLVGDDDIDRVLAMVGVCDHGHDVAD